MHSFCRSKITAVLIFTYDIIQIVFFHPCNVFLNIQGMLPCIYFTKWIMDLIFSHWGCAHFYWSANLVKQHVFRRRSVFKVTQLGIWFGPVMFYVLSSPLSHQINNCNGALFLKERFREAQSCHKLRCWNSFNHSSWWNWKFDLCLNFRKLILECIVSSSFSFAKFGRSCELSVPNLLC